MSRSAEYLRRLQARLTEVADGRELEAIAQGKPVPKSAAEIRALVAENSEYRESGKDEDAPHLTAAAPATDHPSHESGADGRPADWPASWHPVTAGEIAEALIAEIRNALIPARHACRKRSLPLDVPTVTAIDRALEMTTVCAERLYTNATNKAEHVQRDIWREKGSYETHEAHKRDLAAALGIAESTDWIALICHVLRLSKQAHSSDAG